MLSFLVSLYCCFRCVLVCVSFICRHVLQALCCVFILRFNVRHDKFSVFYSKCMVDWARQQRNHPTSLGYHVCFTIVCVPSLQVSLFERPLGPRLRACKPPFQSCPRKNVITRNDGGQHPSSKQHKSNSD